MSNISDTLEENFALQGAKEDSGIISLRRGNASKNITLSDWDQLVQGTAISVSDIERLYSLLNVIIPIIDDSIVSHESSIDAIELIVSDVVRKSLGSDSTQHIEGTVSLDKVVSNVAEFNNATVHGVLSTDGATKISNAAIDTETLHTDDIAAKVGKIINVLSDMTTKGIVASGTISASTIRSSKILPDYATSSVQLGAESIDKFELQIEGKASVSGDLDVGGNLNVKGSTVTQHQQSLFIEDNIIVVKSSGASFSTSGLVVYTDTSATSNNAYGILYDPTKDAVMIGIGTVRAISDDANLVESYEFDFTKDEALPLAARYGFSDTQDAVVPVWNSEKNAFSPSPIKFNGSEAKVPSIATNRIYAALLRGTRVDIGSGNKTTEAGSGSYVVMGNGNEIQEGAQNVCLIGEGLKTIYSGRQIVGKFNSIGDALMWMCGNGNSETERSNAFGTDYSGNLFISNEAYVYQRGRGISGGATGLSAGRKRLLREDERVWRTTGAYDKRASFVKFRSNASGDAMPGYHGFAPVVYDAADIVLYNNTPIYTYDSGEAININGIPYYKLDNIVVHSTLHIDSKNLDDSYVSVHSAYCDAFIKETDTYAQRLDVTNFVNDFGVANPFEIASYIQLYY